MLTQKRMLTFLKTLFQDTVRMFMNYGIFDLIFATKQTVKNSFNNGNLCIMEMLLG